VAPRPRPHPLTELYAEAEKVYREAQARLGKLRETLSRLEAELQRMEAELSRDYGPGYLTVKTVRNRAGRRYRYPVWRRLGGGEVYLTRDPRARELLALREQIRQLRRQITRAKHVARTAWVLM